MRNAEKSRWCVLALGAIAMFFVSAQPVDIFANAKAERTKILLSESVRVALTIEGAAPLRVELPKQLLTDDTNAHWRIRPDGPAAITPLINGRERWQQVYKLDPFRLGEPLRAVFNAVTVNRQTVTFPTINVTVQRTSAAVEPLSITTIEDVPLPPPPPVHSSWLWLWLVVALVGMAVLAVVWRRSRPTKPLSPREWAHAAFAKLEASHVSAEGIATVLREFVERRFAIRATQLTTAELLAVTAQQGWPVEQADTLRTLLDECDRAKFAGETPDTAAYQRLLHAAASWVDEVTPPPATNF